MKKYDNLYCKIFIDMQCERDELLSLIADTVNGRKTLFRTIESDCFEVDVNENEEFYSKKKDDSFLYYKFFLDVEPCSGVDEDKYIEQVSKLLQYFVSQKINIVPACDFEEELLISK